MSRAIFARSEKRRSRSARGRRRHRINEKPAGEGGLQNRDMKNLTMNTYAETHQKCNTHCVEDADFKTADVDQIADFLNRAAKVMTRVAKVVACIAKRAAAKPRRLSFDVIWAALRPRRFANTALYIRRSVHAACRRRRAHRHSWAQGSSDGDGDGRSSTDGGPHHGGRTKQASLAKIAEGA